MQKISSKSEIHSKKDPSNKTIQITVIEKHVLLQVCFSSAVQWPLHEFYWKWGGGGGILTCLCEMPQVIATSVIHDSANIIPFERKEVWLIFGQKMKNDKYNCYDISKNFCP